MDANVLVSALISTAGPPRQIAGAWVEGRFELVLSPALLDELRDVLHRPRFAAGSASPPRTSSSIGLALDATIIERALKVLTEDFGSFKPKSTTCSGS